MRGEKPKREFKGAKWKYFRKEPTVPDAAARPKNRQDCIVFATTFFLT